MPIRPENKKLYPKHWKQIRKDILKRANNRCEFCGVDNYAEGYRNKDGEFIKSEGMQQEAVNSPEFKGENKIEKNIG